MIISNRALAEQIRERAVKKCPKCGGTEIDQQQTKPGGPVYFCMMCHGSGVVGNATLIRIADELEKIPDEW